MDRGTGDGVPRASYGVVMGISGVVAVALGGVLAGSHPTTGATLVGLPLGLTAWLLLRAGLGRTGAGSPARPGTDAQGEADGEEPRRTPVAAGSDQ